MKKFFVFTMGACLFACSPTDTQTKAKFPTEKDSLKPKNNKTKNITELVKGPGILEFDETSYDFGTIQQGEIVDHVFRFKNVQKEPVTILQARASCGCTLAEKPEEPIAPNEYGEIKVSFNSKGKKYKISKSVRMTTNLSDKAEIVYLKGYVEVPEENN